MQNNTLLTFLARRASTAAIQNPSLVRRCYCSPPSSSSPPPPSNKLFVGGLPEISYELVMVIGHLDLDEKSLKDAFSSFGEVTEVNIVYDKDSGRSRGFGFVHFSKEDDAKCAKDAMDGKALLGRPLRISFALEREFGADLLLFLSFQALEMLLIAHKWNEFFWFSA